MKIQSGPNPYALMMRQPGLQSAKAYVKPQAISMDTVHFGQANPPVDLPDELKDLDPLLEVLKPPSANPQIKAGMTNQEVLEELNGWIQVNRDFIHTQLNPVLETIPDNRFAQTSKDSFLAFTIQYATDMIGARIMSLMAIFGEPSDLSLALQKGIKPYSNGVSGDPLDYVLTMRYFHKRLPQSGEQSSDGSLEKAKLLLEAMKKDTPDLRKNASVKAAYHFAVKKHDLEMALLLGQALGKSERWIRFRNNLYLLGDS